MGDVFPFAPAMKFPCALHCLLNLLIPLYLLIQSLNNVKYGSWWPAGCFFMLAVIYLLPANTLSICLGRSRICSKRKETAIDKFWETNCDWSRRVEAGGRFTWLKCHLQHRQHPSHIAVGPVIWLQQPALWRQDQVNRSSCTSALMVGTPQHAVAMAQPYRLVQRRHWGESLRSCRRDRHMGFSITETWWGYEEKHCVGFPFHC